MPQPRAIVPDQGGVSAGFNGTVTAIPKYRLVKRSTLVDSITPATDGTADYVGVTMAVIPPGYAGDVQVARRPLVEAAAAIPIGSKVMAAAGGKAVVATAGNYSIGTANSAALVDTDLIEVDIDRTLVHA